jgi:hypothetical protein
MAEVPDVAFLGGRLRLMGGLTDARGAKFDSVTHECQRGSCRARVTAFFQSELRQQGSGATLTEQTAWTPQRCRCGRTIPEGAQILELKGFSEQLAPLFGQRCFCSGQCVRAEMLETFESLDAIMDSPASAYVSDVRQTYGELLMILLDLPNFPAFRPRG